LKIHPANGSPKFGGPFFCGYAQHGRHLYGESPEWGGQNICGKAGGNALMWPAAARNLKTPVDSKQKVCFNEDA
jgi:hypothetical protein